MCNSPGVVANPSCLKKCSRHKIQWNWVKTATIWNQTSLHCVALWSRTQVEIEIITLTLQQEHRFQTWHVHECKARDKWAEVGIVDQWLLIGYWTMLNYYSRLGMAGSKLPLVGCASVLQLRVSPRKYSKAWHAVLQTCANATLLFLCWSDLILFCIESNLTRTILYTWQSSVHRWACAVIKFSMAACEQKLVNSWLHYMISLFPDVGKFQEIPKACHFSRCLSLYNLSPFEGNCTICSLNDSLLSNSNWLSVRRNKYGQYVVISYSIK